MPDPQGMMNRMGITAPLRPLVDTRTWRQLGYVLATAPLAVVSFGYAVVVVVLGAGLAITAAGMPLLGAGLAGARRIGDGYRWLSRALIAERIARPPARTGSRLGDPAGWRALAYLALRLPVLILQLYVVTVTWGWGVVSTAYPLLHLWRLNDVRAFDTPLRETLVCLAGITLLLLAPKATAAALLPDRYLMRWLLGRRGLSDRIRDLEETRSLAVDDAAATLRHLERDLHDGAQVRLSALIMQLTLIRELAPDGPVRDTAERALGTAREAVTELRELVRGIHPAGLDQGLAVALSTLANQTGVPVELRVEVTPRPSRAIESMTYFCAAELLANVTKHSGADRAWLSVRRTGDQIRLRVRDDGTGGAQIGTGSGLPGLIGRIRTVDGRLEVVSPPGGPTVVTVDLPVHT